MKEVIKLLKIVCIQSKQKQLNLPAHVGGFGQTSEKDSPISLETFSEHAINWNELQNFWFYILLTRNETITTFSLVRWAYQIAAFSISKFNISSEAQEENH